jgi:hypothetical protein
LIGKPRGIARRAECIAGENRRRLVVLAASGSVGPERDDDVRMGHADEPNEVAEDLFAAPALEGLFDAERIAEVDRTREKLLGPVEAVCCEQLLSPKRGERVEELRSDLVLPAIAARRGREHGAHAKPLAHHRKERVVLVVGMRRRHHQRLVARQTPQRQAKACLAAVEVADRSPRRDVRSG